MSGEEDVSASTTTPITRTADLAVTKAADATSVAAGGGITFTLTVTNTGPSDSTGVVLTDLLPPPLQFAAAGSDDDCALAAGDVVCTIGTVAAGTTRTLTIAATLPSDAASASVTNTASVTSDVDDPDNTDDSASVNVDVVQAADLAVTKTAAAEGVLLGGTMAYTLTVVNEGPSDAADAVLTETIPAGTTVSSLPPGCTDDGSGTVTCALGDLAAGDSVVLDLVLAVPDTLAPGRLTNTASVTSATGDPDPSDDSATATVEAVAQANVVLTKELVTTNPVAGQPLEYRLTVVNNGPTVAPNASISDPIPAGTTFVSLTADQGTCQLDVVEDAPAASCSLGRLAVGATATATLIVDTNPNRRSVSNTGFSGSGGLDIAPENNEDTAPTPLQQVADLSVRKSGPETVLAGDRVEYVLRYHNDGPSTATAVVVTDTLPTGLTPRPANGCTTNGATVSCAVGTVAPAAGGTVTITADVDPGLAEGTELTDVAAIRNDAEGAEDPDASDDTSEVTSTVERPTAVSNDVAVTVTANQDRVHAGDLASYNVVVTNNGPQRANAVELANELPAALRVAPLGGGGESRLAPLQVPVGCVQAGRTVTCDLGALAVGASRTLVFTGRVAVGAVAGTRLVHTATVAFDGTDSVAANNRDADFILVIAQPPASTTTTTPAVTTTTVAGTGSGGGSLPVVGAAIAGLLAVAGVLVVSGGGLQGIVRWPAWRRRRPDQ
jgi:uncharacterized repeat protein (TIGR01451 family)